MMLNSQSDVETPDPLHRVPQKMPKPLVEANYPDVKHWHHRQRDKAQYTAINVTSKANNADEDSSSESSDGNSNGATSRRKDNVFAFLEKESGELISVSEKEALYDEVHAWWNNNVTAGCIPRNWSSAGAMLRDKFRFDLEVKFPFLCLCSGHWKVDELWKKNYHSWKTTFLQRLEKEKKRTHAGDETTQISHNKQAPNTLAGDHNKESSEDKSEETLPKKKAKHDCVSSTSFTELFTNFVAEPTFGSSKC